MPRLAGILETALYVDDLDRSGVFYQDILGLVPMLSNDRMRAYDISGKSVLLLFVKGGTTGPVVKDGGTIPPHDGDGHLHTAFVCSHSELEDWDRHLFRNDVEIEGRMDWDRGGKSIYFRDPDDHLLEIAAAPGLWPGY